MGPGRCERAYALLSLPINYIFVHLLSQVAHLVSALLLLVLGTASCRPCPEASGKFVWMPGCHPEAIARGGRPKAALVGVVGRLVFPTLPFLHLLGSSSRPSWYSTCPLFACLAGGQRPPWPDWPLRFFLGVPPYVPDFFRDCPPEVNVTLHSESLACRRTFLIFSWTVQQTLT